MAVKNVDSNGGKTGEVVAEKGRIYLRFTFV